MILGANGIKMGKRHPEYVVNPSDVVDSHGADSLRLYEMFMGPLSQDKPWSGAGIDGAKRFIERIYRIFEDGKVQDKENKNLEKIYHQTIKKVTNDYETLNFNTAISQLMIFVNAVYKEDFLPREYAEGFVKIISPVCPHLGEELWSMLGHDNTIAYEKWPEYDESLLKENSYTLAVQVNGKVRATITVDTNDTEDDIKKKATEEENVKRHIEGKEIVKNIVLQTKLVHIVVK